MRLSQKSHLKCVCRRNRILITIFCTKNPFKMRFQSCKNAFDTGCVRKNTFEKRWWKKFFLSGSPCSFPTLLLPHFQSLPCKVHAPCPNTPQKYPLLSSASTNHSPLLPTTMAQWFPYNVLFSLLVLTVQLVLQSLNSLPPPKNNDFD